MGLTGNCISITAGVLKKCTWIHAVCNLLVNSYKRLVPGYDKAPCYIAWSGNSFTINPLNHLQEDYRWI